MKKPFIRAGMSMFLVIIVLIVYSFTERNLPEDLRETALSAQNDFCNTITNKKNILIIDYRLPVFSKRLWLYDCENEKVLINSHVSHAAKSGLVFAKRFSNQPRTKLSCTGSFVTQEDYDGNYGYSMRIDGLEESNNNARKRAIVFHPLVSFNILGIKFPKKIFYSLGCFSLNEKDLTEIIKLTKNGTLVYVHRNE